MIPMVAVLKLEGRRRLTLWLPLILLYVLLLPLLFVILILVAFPLLIARTPPWSALRAIWGVATGLSGVTIEASGRANALSLRFI